MKKVTITRTNGSMAGAEMLDPTAWIADCVASNAWGLPERWVLHKDEPMAQAYDEADVLEERTVEDMPAVESVMICEAIPAIPAVMDDAGNIVESEIPEVPAVWNPALPAKTHKEVKLKAEYTIEIEDISAQVEQERINAEALAYLASTDWYILREMDAGIPCPVEVKAERAAARARIIK